MLCEDFYCSILIWLFLQIDLHITQRENEPYGSVYFSSVSIEKYIYKIAIYCQGVVSTIGVRL